LREEWRKIPSFPRYEASSFGAIRSKFRVLKPWLNDDGYRCVQLYADGGVRVTKHVHHLVCEAFHGPKPAWAHHAAHRNGRKLSNRPDNLRWSTVAQNAADKKLHGTSYEGERHHFSTFTASQIKTIRVQYSKRPTPSEIKRLAEAFMVRPATIRRIINRSRWKGA